MIGEGDVGYLVDLVVSETVFVSLFCFGCFLMFYVWKLPHNVQRLKVVQKWFGASGTLISLFCVVLSVDSKCHFEIFYDRVIDTLLLLMISAGVPPVVMWSRAAF